MFTCAQCGKRSATTPHRTVTGRELCSDCHGRLLGAAAGVMAAGPAAPTPTLVTTAVATSGIFARLRRRRGRRGDTTS